VATFLVIMAISIYPEGNYPEIIQKKQSTNHNSVLGGIHGRVVGNMGIQQISLQ